MIKPEYRPRQIYMGVLTSGETVSIVDETPEFQIIRCMTMSLQTTADDTTTVGGYVTLNNVYIFTQVLEVTLNLQIETVAVPNVYIPVMQGDVLQFSVLGDFAAQCTFGIFGDVFGFPSAF